jgi:hypothetical protein
LSLSERNGYGTKRRRFDDGDCLSSSLRTIFDALKRYPQARSRMKDTASACDRAKKRDELERRKTYFGNDDTRSRF